MSKWIHGRRGRLFARISSGLVLVALLLLLAPPQLHAQPTNEDLAKLFGIQITQPTPIVVLDFVNTTDYRTGMLGRVFSDALSIELLNTKKFEVVKREDLQRVMEQENLSETLPMSRTDAMVMIADRLQCPYVINGTVDNVQIVQSREGTYAEVTVSTLVVSKVTKLPISGARVVQRSSPKLGFTGTNTDVLVHEALATAAYQTSYRLMDNRLPIATVLTSVRQGEIQLRGGSTIGLKEGMTLVTVRRETVTGRIRLTNVNPTESDAVVLSESGLALGDKAVPIFELNSVTRVSKKQKENAGMQLVGLGALAVLAAWVAGDAGHNDLNAGANAVTVRSMADPTRGSAEYQYGANVVRWSASHIDKIVAYVVFRESNPNVPVAVVPRTQNYWVDTAMPLPRVGDVVENIAVEVTIDAATGEVEPIQYEAPDYETDYDSLRENDMELDEESFSVTTRRVPLTPGERVRYRVHILWKDYDPGEITDELGHPEEYRLDYSEEGQVSNFVTLIPPVTLDAPIQGQMPAGGIFRSEAVPGMVGTTCKYLLQVSDDPNFANPARIISREGALEGDGSFVVATITQAELYDRFRPSFNLPIYWRFGAKSQLDPDPRPFNSSTPDTYVFSAPRSFILPQTPPDVRSRTGGIVGAPPKTTSGREGREGRGGILRR